MAKKLAVTDPNGNPILMPEEARERFADDGGEGAPGPKVSAEAARIPDAEAAAEPSEPRYPKNPADWRAPHYMGLFGRISRAWDACPDELKPNLMTMILPLFAEKQ